MKISVIICYFNRRSLILHTLKTISQTSHKDIEVIIVDDASDPEYQLDDIVNNYWFPIKLIKINPEQRWWKKDPAVCVGIATEAAIGEVLVVQQPECCYVGDLLFDVYKNTTDNMVVSYSCYTLNECDTRLFINNQSIVYRNVQTGYKLEESTWLNHPVILPVGYTYCMAVTKQTWKMLGGVDMDYAYGLGYTDIDLRERIYYSGFQMIIPSPDTSPFIVHLFHSSSGVRDDPLVEKNREI